MKATLRKMTHKGEIEVEEETYKDMDTRLDEPSKDYTMDYKPSQSLTDSHHHSTGVSVCVLFIWNNAVSTIENRGNIIWSIMYH